MYRNLTGEPLDTRRVAELSTAVRGASSFDRPEAIANESTRLQTLLAAADPGTEFVTRVRDNIGPYDHDFGPFTVTLFTPGSYLPVEAFGQEYQVVFANADAARVIPMPRDAARDFDVRLTSLGRQVLDEVRFRVTGSGDPDGSTRWDAMPIPACATAETSETSVSPRCSMGAMSYAPSRFSAFSASFRRRSSAPR